MSKLHYRRLPRFAVHWNGNNKRRVLEFCKGAARIEGPSVFIDNTLEGTIEVKKGECIVNKNGTNYWTASPEMFKYFTKLGETKKSRKYRVDIHSLRVWAKYLLRWKAQTFVELC